MSYQFTEFLVNGVSQAGPTISLQINAETTIQAKYDLVYPTGLSIYSAQTVARNVPFMVSGFLTYVEGKANYGLQGKTVSLRCDGTSIESAVTGAKGDYAFQVILNSAGTFTLTVEFAGYAGLAASLATFKMSSQAR